MHGHPIFFRAFFNFLSQGNEIVIIPGNHDIEFAIPEVQHCFRNALLHLILDEDKNKSNISDVINRNLFFLPWFYYEPGLLYVEHGHQYDSLNSFEYFLHPLTPDNLIDLPAGSFFVRYLFNKVESDYPFADNMKPVSRFIWWLLVRILKGGLFLTKRVRSQLYHYLDFFWQTINKAGPLPPKWIPELEKLQRQAIHRIANDTGIAEEKLLSIKNMWAKSDIHHLDKLNLVLRFFRDDPNNDFYFKFFEKIRDILEVQYIVFGHTHEADLQLLGSPDQAAKGINSGTWTKVFAENYEERLLQDENELVFVKIDRLGPQMELMRWRDDLDEGQRVRLFEAPDGQVLKTNLSAS
jgi:UDP-2,3-diacylglucosamine pyrophosphatase LpxH